MYVSFETILPANGWDAIFDDGKYTRVPLIGWGFSPAQHGKDGKIIGLVPGAHLRIIECEEMEEFLCYVPQGVAYPYQK